MTTRPLARAALLAAVLAIPGPASAQDRPLEEELFGPAPAGTVTSPGKAAPSPPASPPEGGSPRPEEAELFGSQASPAAPLPPPRAEVPREKEDTLKVGGQVYLRAVTFALQDQAPGDWALRVPNLLDVYLDVRPNDRVRGFVLGRLFYDPTIPAPTVAAPPPTLASFLVPQALSGQAVANPRAVLDQLWVNFDVERRAFVTVGRQHTKWGVGRFWNPTDYLHPVKRDPLATFDVRTGTSMVKVHVPWEARGWNLYGVAVVEDVAGDPPRKPDGSVDAVNRLGRIGYGGRAEVVVAGAEVGADALVQDGHRPRFGVDLSMGVWDLDVHAEGALRTTVDTPRWREIPGETDVLRRYQRDDPLGFTPQVVVGANYSVKYSDEDAVTFGAEYFYDRSGYEGPQIYPGLLAISSLSPYPQFTYVPPGGAATTVSNPYAGQPNPFTSFYLGRHYGGTFVSLPAPGRWNDTNFTLSVLGNLSDKSFIARLDHNVLLLTYLRLETYVASHFGSREGEFRLGFTIPSGSFGGLPFAGFSTAPQVFEAGIALRVSL
jgi:hypothetical protein